ncbi:MAG: hypothetical protein LBT19_00145 [Candidatus Nomurabacteria bacterium]|jgi:exonuclease VII small subunit|nr:hypothetical protein [Candidatus Nomurabacteria bacterium]
MSQPNNINKKLDELKIKIEWFYSDDFDLSKATKEYKNTIDLAKEIEKDLTSMKNEIKVLAEDFN